MENFKKAIRKIINSILVAAVIVSIVAVLGIVFGFLTQGQVVLHYVFFPNFVISAIIIAVGFIGSTLRQGFLSFLSFGASQSSAMASSEMYTGFMEKRKRMHTQGRDVLWVGLAAALLTGVAEILLWLLMT